MEKLLIILRLIKLQYIKSILLLLLLSGLYNTSPGQSVTVTTDQANYAPEETVIISGSGWKHIDSVQISLTHLNPQPNPYHTHVPVFVRPSRSGAIHYDWFVTNLESGTSLELRAVGFKKGIPGNVNATTYFMIASITDVTVNGYSFCGGQHVAVRYTISPEGSFDNGNIFTAQLSDNSGSFSSPVTIGNLLSVNSGIIDAIIPSGTIYGTHYKIRVVSGSPVITSNPDESDITVIPPPGAPVVGTLVQPTCQVPTGSVELSNLPATGIWTLTRSPEGVTTTGTGTNTTVSGLSSGTYSFEVTIQDGCTSAESANAVINPVSSSPPAPHIGTITQPTYEVPNGSVELSGLPSPGSWILTRHPDQEITEGSGASYTVRGLAEGVYTYTVTNSYGCTSIESAEAVIINPGKPDLIITDPPAVCSPATVDITTSGVTIGSTPGIAITYWTNAEAMIEYSTPSAAIAGTYYIKGTTPSGFYDIKPVNAKVLNIPESNAGPDQVLAFQYSTNMSAELDEGETGAWRIEKGEGDLSDLTDPNTNINNLSEGTNVLSWIVTNGVCPADTDKVQIIVGQLVIPTLITPNGDTKNEYFVITGLESLGKTELNIFDRRGFEVFKNNDYDNKWNGVDHNEKPLPNDTYFYILKAANGKSYSGYIVIRR